MKLIKLLGCVALFSLSACVSPQTKNQERIPAYAESSANGDAAECLGNFKSATARIEFMVKAEPSRFPAVLQKSLRTSVKRMEVSCVDEAVLPYGIQIEKDGKVLVESKLLNLSKIFDSEIGSKAMERLKINQRTVFFDRMMVALAAHASVEVAGVPDANYEIFFQTLKALEIPAE